MARDTRGRQHVSALVSAASALRYAVFAFTLACWGGTTLAQDPQATTVQRIARDWLASIDAGDAGGSWDAAAQLLKKAVPREQWIEQLKHDREPLGKVQQRTVLSTNFETSFPGAPDGNYAIVLFRASFDKKPDAAESLTLQRESDGVWRVVGYLLR